MAETQEIAELKNRVSALESTLPSAVSELIYKDPHKWSTRPCPTCKPISTMIGQPFGCVRYAIERTQKER